MLGRCLKMISKLDKVKNFYDKKQAINRIILNRTGTNEIIYGQRALNIQLPNNLRVYTEDYDIYAVNPQKEAKEVEKVLDKHFGGNYFKVQPAKHEGTFKVISKVDGKNYADYTKMERKIPPYTIINGRKYVTLDFIRKDRLKILRNPKAKYRHFKDRDAVNRIKLKERGKYLFGIKNGKQQLSVFMAQRRRKQNDFANPFMQNQKKNSKKKKLNNSWELP